MKKILALALAAVMMMAILAACGDGGGSSSSSTGSQGGSSSSAGSSSEAEGWTYGGNDVSEHQTLRMLMIAPKEQPGHKLVWEKINEHIAPIINATVEVTILLMSDHETRYALELAAGEPYDIVFTSQGWMHYNEEAPKGAFNEITVELVNKYMPLTTQYQTDIELHLQQNFIGGKAYMVPQSQTNISINTIALGIREDLRVANGVPEVTDLASLEVYYDSIKENNPELFPYAATQNNNEMKTIVMREANNKIQLGGSIFEDFFHFNWTPGMTAEQAAAAIEYCGYDDDYVAFAKKMKEWADKGYWSRSAVADTTQIRDAYENGSSASFAQNTGTLGIANNAVNAKGWEAKAIDIYPQAIHFEGATVSGLAVPYNSSKLERALMFIDLLKFDEVPYELYRFGIEGEHWEWVDEDLKIWRRGPANQDEENQDYQYGQGSWGFGSHIYEPRNMEGADPQTVEIFQAWLETSEASPLAGFTLDATPIENEIANLTDIRARYLYVLDFGLVDDVEAEIAAMNKAAEAAGLQKVIDEIQTQVAAWIATYA